MIPYGAVTGLVILAPWVYALAARALGGQSVAYRVFWRSSPAGVDALSFFMPNPSHPLFGFLWQGWLTARPGGFEENVAAIPIVVFLVVGVVLWRTGARLSRYWLGLTLAFGALALGPFVLVGGMNTYVPAPWALLRYVPVIGMARSPARFSVVMMMGVAVLAALAIDRILAWNPGRRRLVLGVLGAVLLFELLPAPRVLYSAVPPAIYARIASDPRDVRVLNLPFGVRDGLSSAGNFSAASQFYQTFHGKPLVGGYLSRVSPSRIERFRSLPTRRALMILSEGRTLTPQEMAEVEPRARTFLARGDIGYVIINRSRASPALVSFALEMFDLEKIGEAGSRSGTGRVRRRPLPAEATAPATGPRNRPRHPPLPAPVPCRQALEAAVLCACSTPVIPSSQAGHGRTQTPTERNRAIGSACGDAITREVGRRRGCRAGPRRRACHGVAVAGPASRGPAPDRRPERSPHHD